MLLCLPDLFHHGPAANNVIRKLDAATGTVSLYAGVYGNATARTDGPLLSATFNSPLGIVVDPSGQVYVSEWVRVSFHRRIRRPLVAFLFLLLMDANLHLRATM